MNTIFGIKDTIDATNFRIQTLSLNEQLSPPIKLYRTHFDNLFYIFMGLLCIGLFAYNYYDGNISILFIINLLGGLMFLTAGVMSFIHPKPALIIYRHGIEEISVFGRTNFIAFDKIQNMDFDYREHKGSKKWRIKFTYFDNNTTILRLRSLTYKNNAKINKLNERQLFVLIEQVYQDKTIPSLNNMTMNIHDHIAKEGYILCAVVISFALLTSVMIAYLEWLN